MVPTTLVFHVDRYYAGVYALFHLVLTLAIEGLPCWLRGKERAGNAGDVAGAAGSIPGSGRSPGNGNGNPLQYSCPENSMDRGAWQAPVHTVHGVAELDTTE